MPARLLPPIRHGQAAGRPGGLPVLGLAAIGRAALLTLSATLAAAQAPAPADAPAAADERGKNAAQRLKLTTSDGVALAAWFYPATPPEADAAEVPAGEAPPAPVAILLHDLGGSHESVEPLAKALQSLGIAVVAPDLRGHGASTGPTGRTDLDPKAIKRPDFEAMTMTGGGQVREDAARQGDVETVRNWIFANAARQGLDTGRLVVVGSGAGAAVAAHWTALDAKWPDLASGPQGRQVRGLVLVSPAWTTRGFSISPALAAAPLRTEPPILIVAGAGDDDAVKLYDLIKRARPDGWSEKRVGQAAATASPRLAEGTLPSLYLRQFDSGLSADRLASQVPRGDAGPVVTIIRGFIDTVTAAAE